MTALTSMSGLWRGEGKNGPARGRFNSYGVRLACRPILSSEANDLSGYNSAGHLAHWDVIRGAMFRAIATDNVAHP